MDKNIIDIYRELDIDDKMDIENEEYFNSMNAFEGYIYDVSMIDNIDLEYRELLMNEIIDIINKLNQLFIVVGCNDLKFRSGRSAWITDKVEYSLKSEVSNDVKIKISQLYEEFLKKRNIVLDSYLKFVIFIAKDIYKSYGIPFEELVQFGNLGLIRAIETYNYDYNIKFTTYANKWIRHSIMYNSKKVMHQIRKPSHIYELNNKRIKAINELSYQLGYYPTSKEVAEKMGVSLEKVKLLEDTFLELISLDEEIELYYDDVCIIKKDSLVDDTINVEEEVIYGSLSDELNKCLDDFLNENQKLVIKYIYFDDLNKSDIALKLGLTGQRICQIHAKALTKLAGKPKVRELKREYFKN